VSRAIVADRPRRLFPRAPHRHPESRDPLEALRRRFCELEPFTLGLEEELFVVDPETLMPLSAAAEALTAMDGEEGFAAELRASQIELITPVCTSPVQAATSLAALRQRLRRRFSRTLSFIAAGAHPLATEPGLVTPQPRYEAILRDYPWAARMTLTCGLHVHVAVPGCERTLAVYNALRGYLPLIGAIAANSPFHGGEDSGMSSVRSALNSALLRTGIPPAFASWEEYDAFLRWGARATVIPDASFHWWDMRLSPRLGTIEVRVADAQTRIEDSAAIAALVQALAATLARRYDDGEQLAVYPTEYIQENAWLAARDGTGGLLVDLESAGRQPTAEALAGLIRELAPAAAELGSQEQLDGALRLVLETGADRQRRVAAAAGIDGLLYWLAAGTAETAEGARPLPATVAEGSGDLEPALLPAQRAGAAR
jgi:carboxylate-amine ligase